MAPRLRTRSAERGGQLAAALDEPGLAPFLPAIYVAWVDGDLTEEDIAGIRSRVRAHDGLSAGVRECLELWLDPDEPPNSVDLDRLLARITAQATDLPPADRWSLLELGVDLGGERYAEPEATERAVLTEIVGALGEVGRGALRLLPLPDRLVGAEPRDPAPTPAPDTPLDAVALHRYLVPDHRDIREGLMRLMLDEGVVRREEWSRDEYRAAVLAWCRRVAEAGYGGLSFPEAHGGRDDLGAFFAAFETLAYGDLSLLVKYGVQFGLFGGALMRLGTERHHERWLADVGTLALPGAFAMTETGHGSDVQQLQTVARYDTDAGEFVLDTPDEGARKDYIGNALQGRMAVVFAQLHVDGTEQGVHAFAVPLRDGDGQLLAGVRVEDCGEKVGLNGVDNGRLWFDGVRVPREDMLDRFATVHPDGTYSSPIASSGKRFFTMIGTLVHGRVAVATAALSAAKTALAIAVRYGNRRRQFRSSGEGEPETLLLDYPSHQQRLLPRLATTYAMHFALRHLIATDLAVTRDEDASARAERQLESLAAGLKAASTWHTTDTIQACREACGGAGYLAENRFGALREDTDVFTTFEGDNTVLLQLVAKGLLSDYSQQFEDMNVLKALRLFAARTADVLAESNPMAGRSTDTDHLRDRDFHLESFRFRSQHILSGLGRRLKRMMDDGDDLADAFLAVQDHVLSAARAHSEQVVLEQFAAAVEACPDDDLRPVLGAVCDLYALSRLQADRAWFIEHNQFSPAKAKAVCTQVGELCAELRPHAVALVDAFGIPDELLAAPIAMPEGTPA